MNSISALRSGYSPSQADDRNRLATLLERCRDNDQDAWSEIVRRFQRLVAAVPKRMGLNKDDASDVAQATFIALFRNLYRIKNPGCLPTWMAVTAAREALRVRRRLNKQPISLEVPELESRASHQRNPEQLAIARLESEQIRSVVSELPERDRALVSSIFLEEATYKEIGAQLKMPVGAIGPTRARALSRLRTKLSERGLLSRS
jgi:RNA polymerase sigma factor (sigma-70 family)